MRPGRSGGAQINVCGGIAEGFHAVAALDQLTKLLAKTYLMGKTLVLIPGWLQLHYITNDGMALSLLSGKRWLFVALTAVYFAVVIWAVAKKYIYKKPEYKDAAYSLAQIKDSGILTSIEGYNVWGDKVLTATGKDMTELLDTFTGEMKDLTIDTLKNEMPVLRIDGIYKADGYSNSIYGYYVYPSFTKTLNMLKELGVTEEDMSDRISLEQIQSITVNDYGYLAAKDGEENKNYSASVFYEAEADGDDAAKIKELNEHIVLSNFIWSNGILHPVENSIDAQVQLYRTSGNDKNGYVNIWKGEVPTSIEQDLRENRVYYE